MKLFAHCTKAYMPMYGQYFKASIPSSFDLHFEEDPDVFSDLTYTSDRDKNIAYWDYLWGRIVSLIEQHDGQVIVWTGVDIEFFADVVPDLAARIAYNDVVFMDDVGCRCPEFMTIRCSKVVADTFRMMPHLYRKMPTENDSTILTGMRLPFRAAMLPKSYWTIGWCTMRNIPTVVPSDIQIYHANYTVGFQNKMDLLAKVRSEAAAMGKLWASEQERLAQ